MRLPDSTHFDNDIICFRFCFSTFSLSKIVFVMPRKSKRKIHSTAICYSFLGKRAIESDNCSGSSEGGLDIEVNDRSQERPNEFKEQITTADLSDLLELCKSKCPLKYLCSLLYMTLRKFGVSWRNCDVFFKEIGELLK